MVGKCSVVRFFELIDSAETFLRRLYEDCSNRLAQRRLFHRLTQRRLFEPLDSPSGQLLTQKLKSHLVRTQNLNVLPLKPGVGQYIAIHATHTARDFFLSCLFLHFRSIHLHFFPNLSRFFFPVLAVANTGSCVGPQNNIGHHAGCRFPYWVPAEYK